MFTAQDNNGGGGDFAVTISAEMDEHPFIAITIEREDDGRMEAELIITSLGEAETFVQEAREALAQFKRQSTQNA